MLFIIIIGNCVWGVGYLIWVVLLDLFGCLDLFATVQDAVLCFEDLAHGLVLCFLGCLGLDLGADRGFKGLFLCNYIAINLTDR